MNTNQPQTTTPTASGFTLEWEVTPNSHIQYTLKPVVPEGEEGMLTTPLLSGCFSQSGMVYDTHAGIEHLLAEIAKNLPRPTEVPDA